jgi:hypothetical protein
VVKHKPPRPDGGGSPRIAVGLIVAGVLVTVGSVLTGSGQALVGGLVITLALFVAALVAW